ncbi:MAG: HpcH/HpaI aldolase/citrate lyase family protein, partial [Campylobacterota bacterium]|nr:HpcH/HpaI aldolase/citrate lyase family protein [Campylobacterota bacterium]
FLLKKRIHNILTIRVGAEDMFKMIGIKKDCNTSIHDLHVSSRVLADILATFKPYGFNVSSTVYNCLKNLEFFTQEVRRDVKEGLFGKTLIHPSQIDITNEVYRVSKDELEEAEIILKKDEAIYRHNDKMIESSVHKSWASTILKRFEVYGVTN